MRAMFNLDPNSNRTSTINNMSEMGKMSGFFFASFFILT